MDIIRSEMKAIEDSPSVVLSSETAEMIEQIFSASETAINILDDLLNYEHMDSGRFTPTYLKNQMIKLSAIAVIRNLQFGSIVELC